MNAFAAAMDAIFADANMAVEATWTPGGVGPATPVSLIRKAPDELTEFGAARILSDTLIVDIRVSEAPGFAAGDMIDIGGVPYTVQGEPQRDREQLIWTAELVPS
jgi:hypothetical protein